MEFTEVGEFEVSDSSVGDLTSQDSTSEDFTGQDSTIEEDPLHQVLVLDDERVKGELLNSLFAVRKR